MAEDLTEYMDEQGIKVKYIHHNVDTMERNELLRDLRMGIFDVLVGINLLREGIDLPEVTLVAILTSLSYAMRRLSFARQTRKSLKRTRTKLKLSW